MKARSSAASPPPPSTRLPNSSLPADTKKQPCMKSVNAVTPAVPAGPGVGEDHPSWAARRLQQAQLAATPAGTKVVFGDDGETTTTAIARTENAPAESAAPARAVPTTTRVPVARGKSIPTSAKSRIGNSSSRPSTPQARKPVTSQRALLVAKAGKAPIARNGKLVQRARPVDKRACAPAPVAVVADAPSVALHPSWEAKKRMREQQAKQAALMAAAPRGRKMTFDSD